MQPQESYTLKCGNNEHTFYWYNQETWICDHYMYVNINGIIKVYDLNILNTSNGGYQLINIIQYRSPETPMVYPETLLTPSVRNPLIGNMEQDYTLVSKQNQQKQFSTLDPQVACLANIITPQQLNRGNPNKYYYNPETRQIYDGFDENQVEFATGNN